MIVWLVFIFLYFPFLQNCCCNFCQFLIVFICALRILFISVFKVNYSFVFLSYLFSIAWNLYHLRIHVLTKWATSKISIFFIFFSERDLPFLFDTSLFQMASPPSISFPYQCAIRVLPLPVFQASWRLFSLPSSSSHPSI